MSKFNDFPLGDRLKSSFPPVKSASWPQASAKHENEKKIISMRKFNVRANDS